MWGSSIESLLHLADDRRAADTLASSWPPADGLMDVKDGYGMIHASKQHGSDLREPNEAAPNWALRRHGTRIGSRAAACMCKCGVSSSAVRPSHPCHGTSVLALLLVYKGIKVQSVAG